MVTVNFTKAVEITHDARKALHTEKTREHFQTMSNNLARLEFMPEGTEKDDLLLETTAVKDIIEDCVDQDQALAAQIDAVNTDDLVALEAVLVDIEKQQLALGQGY